VSIKASQRTVRVRGTCTAGHTTEGQSDPGRLTREMTCGTAGCGLPVKGRRVPLDIPAPPAATTTAAPGDAEHDPYEVIEVKS
jgi:hypothetical protein